MNKIKNYIFGKSYPLKLLIMKKIIVLICICFLSSLNSETHAASVEQKKTEFQANLTSNNKIENLFSTNPFLSELNYKITNIDQIESCTVTITVYGPLGEPFGTYTGTSWISCDFALQYALTEMLATLFP